MDSKEYSVEQMWKDLNTGYQIYYTYMDRRYMLSKLGKNCYSRDLVDVKEKDPHPKHQIVTLKAVRELFEFMKDIEYKVN